MADRSSDDGPRAILLQPDTERDPRLFFLVRPRRAALGVGRDALGLHLHGPPAARGRQAGVRRRPAYWRPRRAGVAGSWASPMGPLTLRWGRLGGIGEVGGMIG